MSHQINRMPTVLGPLKRHTCSKCKRSELEVKFHKDVSKNSGLTSACTECRRVYGKKTRGRGIGMYKRMKGETAPDVRQVITAITLIPFPETGLTVVQIVEKVGQVGIIYYDVDKAIKVLLQMGDITKDRSYYPVRYKRSEHRPALSAVASIPKDISSSRSPLDVFPEYDEALNALENMRKLIVLVEETLISTVLRVDKAQQALREKENSYQALDALITNIVKQRDHA